MELEVKLGDKTWGIPDPVCCRGIHGVLTGINSLTVFPHLPVRPKSTAESGRCPQGSVKIHKVERSSWVWGQYPRKLVNEALGTFVSLQTAMSEAGDTDVKPLLIKKSREYRSMIQACVVEMNQVLDDGPARVPHSSPNLLTDQEHTDLSADCQLLYKMELVLGLIEILFIDIRPGGVMLGQLLNWIRLHFPNCKTRMAEALSIDNPHQHQTYWDTCYGLVLQGLLEEARNLLSRHPSAHTDTFLSLDELLRKMPTFQAYSGVSESEFKVRWDHWQSECKVRLERGEYSTWKHVETICQILCGDLDTIVGLTDVMDTWYHLMVSSLLYTNPTVKIFRLHSAAQDAIMYMGTTTRIASLDHLLLAAMEVDAHQVIKLCQQVLDNVWFTAHLSDLLHHSIRYKTEHRYLLEIREFLVMDYASELVAHPSLWQVGVVYMENSGTQSSPMVETLLQALPLTEDSKARKVIQVAADRNLDNVVVSVCRVMGRRALSQNRLGAAIWWGVRSRDAAFTSHLAHQMLHKYVSDGEFESASLLDYLGPSMLLSDTLTFLGKYREFHSLYKDRNFIDAGSLLVSLISSKLAPQYFWPVLLVDALPLLQCPKPVITTEQTYQLMYCLHNLTSAQQHTKDMLNNNGTSTFIEKEKDIRQALTSNLSRSIISEGSVN